MKILLLSLLVLLNENYAQAQSLTVNTTQGSVEGYKATDGDYFAFYGLKYGSSVSGENRFKAPSPPPPYPGHFHAMDKGIVCAQKTSTGMVGVEDCLALSIFTKNVTYKKPVFVWLEGEGYLSSGMSPSFKRLVERDIVVISLNYRVSIFGFLCLGVPEAPGNAGLKDVILGLKWIKENIAGFGGDPNNVILLGHGSGAAMVDLITMSPLSNGLVHKVIALSGSALAPWGIAFDPVGYANIVGAKLSYTGKSPSELANSLANTDISLLMPTLDVEFTNNSVLFAPCIENPNLNDTFLTDAPINLLRSANYSHIPYLIGYTDREGTLRANEASRWLTLMSDNFTQFLQVDLSFEDKANQTALVDAIRKFYFGNTSTTIEIEDYLDYHGDTSVLISVLRGAIERGKTSTAEVRLFEFAYRGSTNANWAYPAVPVNGVRHGGILDFLFDVNLTERGVSAMNSLLTRFIQFANTGVPNGSSERATIQWLPAKENSFNYFYYGGSSEQPHTEEPKVNPHSQRMTFWNNIYSNYYKTPSRVSSAPQFLGVMSLVLICQLLLIFN